MIPADWKRLADMLDSFWPGEWTTQKSEAYHLALDAFDPTQVAVAIQSRLHAGDKFRPSAAELVADITGVHRGRYAAPDEAWTLVEQAMRRVGVSRYDARFAAQHQAAIDWLATQDRAAAAWAARRGLCQLEGSLGQEPVNGEHGGAVRGALRRDYRELVTEITERQLEGGEGVPDSMLICRRTTRIEAGGMRDVVDRLRPAHELQAGEPA